jgi:hypothetical protein
MNSTTTQQLLQKDTSNLNFCIIFCTIFGGVSILFTLFSFFWLHRKNRTDFIPLDEEEPEIK